MLDVHLKQGAGIGSNHQLSIAKVRLKLKSQKEVNPVVDRYDIGMLRREREEKDDFKIDYRNRFVVLEAQDEWEGDVDMMSEDVNEAFQ